jgi:hypothetical protein
MYDFLGGSDMLAYLSMMAIRLIELRRVLKPTGSIYMHCDPTAMGVFLCIETPTKPMLKEAADAGFYTSPSQTQHARMQILTIEELLAGRKIDMPPWRELRTFKQAPKARTKRAEQPGMFDV